MDTLWPYSGSREILFKPDVAETNLGDESLSIKLIFALSLGQGNANRTLIEDLLTQANRRRDKTIVR